MSNSLDKKLIKRNGNSLDALSVLLHPIEAIKMICDYFKMYHIEPINREELERKIAREFSGLNSPYSIRNYRYRPEP